jgi:hypothetical protein
MSKALHVRMEIPIPGGMMFYKWLPLNDDAHILIDRNDLLIKYYLDLTCLSNPLKTEEEILQVANIEIEKIYVDVTIRDLRGELIDWIMTRPASGKLTTDQIIISEKGDLQKDYEKLAEKVYSQTLTYFNRLIAYVRIQSGQYWLEEYPINMENMRSDYWKFGAKVFYDNEGIKWYSSEKPQLLTLGPLHLDRYLDELSWSKASEFMKSSERPDLAKDILVRAELLADLGHSRSSIINAITSLEVVINKFAKNIQEECFDSSLSSRMNIKSLNKHIDRLGLSWTLGYLFPIIFTENQVPSCLLKTCQEAINVRNNVVHQGQRHVDKEKLANYLEAIRKLCDFLTSFE